MTDPPELPARPPRMTPELLRRALDMQRRGMTHAAIADRLGLSRQTISKHLAAANARVFARIAKQGEARLGQQVMLLEQLVERAAIAYAHSTRPQVTVERDGTGQITRSTVRNRPEGDPQFLREARAGLADIRAVLKLDDRPGEAVDDGYIIDLGEDRSDRIVLPDDGTDGAVAYKDKDGARHLDIEPFRADVDRPMTVAQAKALGVHIPGETDPPPPDADEKAIDPEHAAFLEREAQREKERQMNPDELALTRWADRRLG